MLLKMIRDTHNADDLIIEYSGMEGIQRIKDDDSLQVAYVQSGDEKLVMGVQLAENYVD
jgi:hypothetical protein